MLKANHNNFFVHYGDIVMISECDSEACSPAWTTITLWSQVTNMGFGRSKVKDFPAMVPWRGRKAFLKAALEQHTHMLWHTNQVKTASPPVPPLQFSDYCPKPKASTTTTNSHPLPLPFLRPIPPRVLMPLSFGSELSSPSPSSYSMEEKWASFFLLGFLGCFCCLLGLNWLWLGRWVGKNIFFFVLIN